MGRIIVSEMERVSPFPEPRLSPALQLCMAFLALATLSIPLQFLCRTLVRIPQLCYNPFCNKERSFDYYAR